MVKVYSSENCPWCVKVKEYLTGLGVEYEEVNVRKDRRAAMEMVKRTKQMSVPVTEIGDKTIIGFNKEELDAALAALAQQK